MVHEIPLFRNIFPIIDIDLVCSLFIERTYPKGQILFFQGDEANELYIVKSGVLKIYQEDDVKEVILGHQFSGEPVGEIEVIYDEMPRLASVATLEKTTLWIIKKDEFSLLLNRYPELLRRILYITCERLNQANQKIYYLTFLDTRLQLANLLLDLYENFGQENCDGKVINWKVTQDHIAKMLGLNRESVTRTLRDFKKEGLISTRKRYLYLDNINEIKRIVHQSKSKIDNRTWHSKHNY